MQRTTGKSGFKMRSGNRPTFAKMGSSPANMRTFGIGQGTSPYKNEEELTDKEKYEQALKNDPNLNQHIKNRDKYEPGSEEYEKYQALVNKAYGKERDQTLKEQQIANVEKEKTNVENKNEELNPDDLETKENIDKEQKSGSRVGQILSGLGKVGAAALTGGLDAVYGTGKIQYTGGGTRFLDTKVDDDKDKKEKEFGKTALDE
tara:strand:- start:590 stop:1201 length:612 start_codon:yes stop_codon:yes gene_type:complete